MKTWIQRPARTALAESGTPDYHGCLDALIATIADMRATAEWHRKAGEVLLDLEFNIKQAEERAAHCAWLLFNRWIEVVPDECADCRAATKPSWLRGMADARFYY